MLDHPQGVHGRERPVANRQVKGVAAHRRDARVERVREPDAFAIQLDSHGTDPQRGFRPRQPAARGAAQLEHRGAGAARQELREHVEQPRRGVGALQRPRGDIPGGVRLRPVDPRRRHQAVSGDPGTGAAGAGVADSAGRARAASAARYPHSATAYPITKARMPSRRSNTSATSTRTAARSEE